MLLLGLMLQIGQDSQAGCSVNDLRCVEACEPVKNAPKRGAEYSDEPRKPSKPDPIPRKFHTMEIPATSNGFDDRVVDARIDTVPALSTQV